jgi:Archaeal fructose-1,6-bisphosphatase and related enzymes of inositol monophosphatase family
MLPAVINIFEKAAKKAGKILTRDFGEIENLQIESKSIGDFVTSADIKVEKSILETLKYYYPDFSYVTEESGNIKGNENTIIIDPIDGTSNFIHGIPHVSIVIAKMTNNEITDGIVYNPILNEFFWASKR